MSRIRRPLAATSAAFIGLLSPLVSAQTPYKPSATVVIRGSDEVRTSVDAALQREKSLPLSLRQLQLPNAPLYPERLRAEVSSMIASARVSYVQAHFARCTKSLQRDDLVAGLLAEGRRSVAARILFWRVACHVAAARTSEARRIARRFAVFGLDPPPDVDVAAPEAEMVLARASEKVQSARKVSVSIGAAVPSRVSVDGQASVCTTPCQLELLQGTHVIAASADGFVPQHRVVEVASPGTKIEIRSAEASPELAASQWSRRYADSPAIDSAASVSLLARAVRDRRMIVIRAEPERGGTRLRGVLAIDGKIAARAERSPGPVGRQVPALLRDLLIRGELMQANRPLTKRPIFWIVLGSTVLATAGATAVLLSDRPISVDVSF